MCKEIACNTHLMRVREFLQRLYQCMWLYLEHIFRVNVVFFSKDNDVVSTCKERGRNTHLMPVKVFSA